MGKSTKSKKPKQAKRKPTPRPNRREAEQLEKIADVYLEMMNGLIGGLQGSRNQAR